MLFGNPLVKVQKLITYSCNIQIIHILVCWSPFENGTSPIIKKINIIIVKYCQ
jgi:hypothetical protein